MAAFKAPVSMSTPGMTSDASSPRLRPPSKRWPTLLSFPNVLSMSSPTTKFQARFAHDSFAGAGEVLDAAVGALEGVMGD